MRIMYRTGRPEDCETLASMINIASDGTIMYLFHDLIPGMTPLQILSHNLRKDDNHYSYKNAIVACEDKSVVGMALSFPSAYHGISDEMRAFFPRERLDHLSDFFSARIADAWYLDALCVAATHRRQGIGEKLITLTKRRALEKGFDTLSLIAFSDNSLALPLYERTGFQVYRHVDLQPNEYIHHKEGCYLMRCDIDRKAISF